MGEQITYLENMIANWTYQLNVFKQSLNNTANNNLTPKLLPVEKKELHLNMVKCGEYHPLFSCPTRYFDLEKERFIGMYAHALADDATLIFVNFWDKTEDIKIIYIESISRQEGIKKGMEIITDKEGYERWIESQEEYFNIKIMQN